MIHVSVIPMKLFTIAGPLTQFDAVVRSCIVNQEFHPESAMQFMKGVRGLRPFDPSNPYTALLHRAEQVADQVGIALEYSSFGDEERTPQAMGDYFDQLEQQVRDLSARREKQLQTASSYRNYVSQLENLKGVTSNLEALWHMDWSRFRYGYLPRETYDGFHQSLEEANDFLFFPTNVESKVVYAVYFTTKSQHDKVDRLFNSLHFARIHVDAQAHGSAVEAMADMSRMADEAEQDAVEAERTFRALCSAEHDRLLSSYSYLRYANDSYDLRRFAAHSKETFYLMGWVPKTASDDVKQRLAAFPELSCVVDNAIDAPGTKPPTKLKNSFLGRTFQPFLEMYGLPAYNELDPSIFMALTYCLFFGVMFGDVGQGLCLALAGILLAKWKKMWLGNIIACCGLAGAVFGCLYGSVFGLEELLPGFKILAEPEHYTIPGVSNVLVLLIASIAAGVLMLAFVMLLNIINGVRQHNYEKIFFGQNGLAGMVFYIGLIVAAICTLLLGVDLFVPAYVLPVLVLPLLLILFKEPLALMLEGDPEWKHMKIGALLSTGFFELFETLLSYLTNTLSFMRVGAYAITHVGLMLVVQMLAGMAGGMGSVGGIIAMVAGNIFVMGFEGLLVGIQVLRLEFYELFGRFYDDGGIPFVPKVIDYTTRAA
jgi:V/A-type H+-transporting ATPase subunit I